MVEFQSMVQFPITRAEFYDLEDVAWDAPHVGIQVLDVDHLGVDNRVNEGRVTLSASGAPSDGYGFEVDLEPQAARALAKHLMLAAEALDQEG